MKPETKAEILESLSETIDRKKEQELYFGATVRGLFNDLRFLRVIFDNAVNHQTTTIKSLAIAADNPLAINFELNHKSASIEGSYTVALDVGRSDVAPDGVRSFSVFKNTRGSASRESVTDTWGRPDSADAVLKYVFARMTDGLSLSQLEAVKVEFEEAEVFKSNPAP